MSESTEPIEVRAPLLKTGEPLTVDRFVDLGETPGRVGVALCGGGSRAMSAGLGHLRGLARLRRENAAPESPSLLGLTKALSAVSGGAWLSGPFLFLPDSIDDETYLGTYVQDPGRLVRRKSFRRSAAEELDQVADGYAGQSVGSPRFTVVGLALQAVLLKRFADVPTPRLWQTMIGLNILKPFGLFQKGEGFAPTSTFSFDAAVHKEHVTGPNPKLADYPVHLVAAGKGRIRRPFWICNASMFVNEPEADGQDLVPVQSTPFFTGILADVEGVDANRLPAGGGAVATFAFDSRPLGVDGTTVRALLDRPFSLAEAVGLSSVAFASGLEQQLDEWRDNHVPLARTLMERKSEVLAWLEEHFESKLPPAVDRLLHVPSLARFVEKAEKAALGGKVGAKLDAELAEAVDAINHFIPEELYWPVRRSELEAAARHVDLRPTRFADGGNLENTGVAALLAYEDVERIVAFVSSPTPMATVERGVFGPAGADGEAREVPDSRILVDSQLAVLFGYRAHAEGVGYRLYVDTPLAELPREERPFRPARVFAPEAFPELLRGLWGGSHGKRRPAIFEQTLQTVANPTFGVRAGREVRVLWVYLDRVDDWLDLLSDDVRGMLGGRGWETFPNFPTNQGLNPRQINLLAHLTSWCVADPTNQAPFQRLFEP